MVFPDPLASHDDPQLQILMGGEGVFLHVGTGGPSLPLSVRVFTAVSS